MKEFERARWRCRRGLLELDIVLQRFMDQHYAQLDQQGLEQFERLLSLPDNDLWDLISARKAPADCSVQAVLELLQKS
jgi:antitoxin CptB